MLLRSRHAVRPCLRTLLEATLWDLSAPFVPAMSQNMHTSSARNGKCRIPPIQYQLRLMPLGGSITHGVGSSDGNGYRKELVALLTANSYDVEMVGSRNSGTMENNNHEGWRGLRIDEIHKKVEKCLDKLQPNLFTINAGSNDCLQNFQQDHIGDRMSDLLEYLWKGSCGSTVILSTLVVNRDPKIDSHVISANRLFRQLVEKKAAEQKRIVLADMYTSGGPTIDDLGEDGIHPDLAGYRKMAFIWYRAIEDAANRGFLS